MDFWTDLSFRSIDQGVWASDNLGIVDGQQFVDHISPNAGSKSGTYNFECILMMRDFIMEPSLELLI